MNAFSPWFSCEPFHPADTFEVGDIVNLVVGGPDMVVTAVCDECSDVQVHWVNTDGDVVSDVLPQEAVAHAA